MKWLLSIWLLTAGIGVSYHVVVERRQKIKFLKEMEQSIGKMAYYMYQWHMPMKEVLFQMAREEKGILKTYYGKLRSALEEHKTEDFGRLWKEQSYSLWQEKCGERNCFGRSFGQEIRDVWAEAFFNMPMEPKAINRELQLRMDQIKIHREALEEKYKGEQKLVFTMGFFVSAFFCLIFL